MMGEVAVDFDAGTVGGQQVPGIQPLNQSAVYNSGEEVPAEQQAMANQILASRGTEVNAWDAASNAVNNMLKSATQGFTLYKTITAPKAAPAPTYAQSQTDTSKWLLYGGLAVAALAVVMVMRKQ
jgi:hypothetical protein